MMNDICIDCARIHNREELHDALALKLSFPEYYGKNLDALYDCLTELPFPVHLTLLHFDHLAELFGEYALWLRQVFEEAEMSNDLLIVTYA
jgi:ribonuclease inhibitor